MRYYILALIITCILIASLASFSHSFKPLSFSISLPKNINVKMNEEIFLNLIITNTGGFEDVYYINLTVGTNDIRVSIKNQSIELSPSETRQIPISIIIYSSLGEDKNVSIKVCSTKLLSFENNNEKIQECSAEKCELEENKNCIKSVISFKVATLTLGYFILELIILPLFLIVFATLLGFAEYRRQKLFDARHH